jgi:hypothetical protein
LNYEIKKRKKGILEDRNNSISHGSTARVMQEIDELDEFLDEEQTI